MMALEGSPPNGLPLLVQVSPPSIEIEALAPPAQKLLNTSTAFGFKGLTETEFSCSQTGLMRVC